MSDNERKIRVRCTDGTAFGATVEDAETGEPIRGVVSVTWRCHAEERSSCTIEFEGIEIDAVSDVEASIRGCNDCQPIPHRGGYGSCECECHRRCDVCEQLVEPLARWTDGRASGHRECFA